MTIHRTLLAAGVAAGLSAGAALAGPQPVTPGVSAPSTSVVSGGAVSTTTQPSGRILFILNTAR